MNYANGISSIEKCLLNFKTLPSEKLSQFTQSINENSDLIGEFFTLFKCDNIDHQQIDAVCGQLFLFLRSEIKELHLFSLQFIPLLILRYLLTLSLNSKQNICGIETFLLASYNLIVNKEGKAGKNDIILPSIDLSSIYHKSPESDVFKLTERNLQNCLTKSVEVDKILSNFPGQRFDRFNSSNKNLILTVLISEYNKNISFMCLLSKASLCQLSDRLSSMTDLRLEFDSSLIIEILTGIYFIMFNGLYTESIVSIKLIHERACFELCPNLLLTTNALLNTGCLLRDKLSATLVPESSIPFPIPTTDGQGFSHGLPITLSSFKIHKLPDDIDIINETIIENDENDNHVTSPNDVITKPTPSSYNSQNESSKLARFGKKMKLNHKSSMKEEDNCLLANTNKDDGNQEDVNERVTVDSTKVAFFPSKNFETRHSRMEKATSFGESSSHYSTRPETTFRKNSTTIVTDF